ncbi:MAG: ATP-binding cassette domain-containing protein [Bacteroidota bacterium]
MSEELLKAIIQLFAIVARERITDEERAKIHEFLSVHLNQESINYYLNLFEQFCCEEEAEQNDGLIDNVDEETLVFVGDWAKIIKITKQMNTSLTKQQKVVLILKIVELVYVDGAVSERQSNLIFYIGEALKVTQDDVNRISSFVVDQEPESLASEHVLIIDDGTGTYPEKGNWMAAKNLTGFIAILRLADIETYFIKYLGISAINLNGIALKSRKIATFPPGSTIRGNKIQPVYYSDIVSKFYSKEAEAKITFQAERIFYHFKSGRAALQNVCIAEEGGKLIGLMGASGSGKSTLLNVLNGNEKPSSGRVIINGINIHDEPNRVEGIIGYVPQDDFLIEELTVAQNLYYAAKLCFGNYSHESLVRLVDKILRNLGLFEIKNLRVGSPMDKTISGGQRKRLNIGLELLREPTVLFVDEPTSGLSSRDSENIMDLLKELSKRGKMVFVVIHQPSSDIFKMFDTLLILDLGGFQIYYGNPVESVTYFREIIDAVNKTQGACPECGNVNVEQVFDIIETRIVNEYGRLTDTRKVSPGQWYQYFREKIKLPKIQHSSEKIKTTQKIPNWIKQLNVFITRDVLSKITNKQYLIINLLEAPLLALFMAFLVRYYSVNGVDHPSYSFYNNDNIPVYFLMGVIVALFMGLMVSAEEIFKDRLILKRERFLHLSRSSYLVSKILVLFGISAIQTLTFVLIGNFILEIKGMWLSLWMILFSCSCLANIVGLNISASFKSAITIYILIPILLIPQLLLSGVVINFDKFNPTVSNDEGVPFIGDIMASRWAFEAAMVTQFRDNKFSKQFYHFDQKAAEADYKKTYYIPALETKLAFAYNHMNRKLTADAPKIEAALDLLKHELALEMDIVGHEHFKHHERLDLQRFDTTAYRAADVFLKQLRSYYVNEYNAALEQRDQIIGQLTGTPEKDSSFVAKKQRYENKAITTLLKNTSTTQRIVESDGHLIQKIYPAYFSAHRPNHAFDYRTKFFSPSKPFLGLEINTLYFNVMIIWLMALLLAITLYFDVLKKIMIAFGGRRRRPRRAKLI